jgi:hypothetical protein
VPEVEAIIAVASAKWGFSQLKGKSLLFENTRGWFRLPPQVAMN